MGNDDGWIEQVRAAADRAGERGVAAAAARASTASMLDSEVADLRNIGTGGGGGALTAGLFLQGVRRRRAVGAPRHRRARHAPAADDGYIVKGGTGFGVRTLVELADSFSKPDGKPKA